MFNGATVAQAMLAPSLSGRVSTREDGTPLRPEGISERFGMLVSAASAIAAHVPATHRPLRQEPRLSGEAPAREAEDRGFEPRRVLPPNRISSAAP
jgi:hypothetical protein